MQKTDAKTGKREGFKLWVRRLKNDHDEVKINITYTQVTTTITQ